MANSWGRIAGAIVIAYIIFTTLKGNLRTWLEIIGLKPQTSGQKPGAMVGLQGGSGLRGKQQ